MGKILDKLDTLFYLNRGELTYKKGCFMIVLVLLVGFSLPIYIKYEDYTYGKYKAEYTYVEEMLETYKSEEGNHPVGEKVDLNKEDDLKQFIMQNNFKIGNDLYYIDTSLIDELANVKNTYIIDTDSNRIYTSEFAVYRFTRWHFVYY